MTTLPGTDTGGMITPGDVPADRKDTGADRPAAAHERRDAPAR